MSSRFFSSNLAMKFKAFSKVSTNCSISVMKHYTNGSWNMRAALSIRTNIFLKQTKTVEYYFIITIF